jgi:hypothetical protein
MQKLHELWISLELDLVFYMAQHFQSHLAVRSCRPPCEHPAAAASANNLVILLHTSLKNIVHSASDMALLINVQSVQSPSDIKAVIDLANAL